MWERRNKVKESRIVGCHGRALLWALAVVLIMLVERQDGPIGACARKRTKGGYVTMVRSVRNAMCKSRECGD